MPLGEPTGFWGKKTDQKDGTVLEWHPLAHHSADVAACAEALMERTLLGQRLARLADGEALAETQVARLCVLAALHDFGKFSIAFQNKRLDTPPFPTRGHLREALGLLNAGYRFANQAWGCLALKEIDTWGEDMDGLFHATISHHGRPVRPEANMQPEWWAPTSELDPFAGIAELIEQTRCWLPAAWEASGERLPTCPEFQHAWSGLLNLADWIGSDAERFFPFSVESGCDRMGFARPAAACAIQQLGLVTDGFRTALGPDPVDYGRLLDGGPPRPAQARMLGLQPSPRGSVVVLEAATGSGKTEAALLHFLRLFQRGEVDGLYFALPLRAAAMQIYNRVCRAVNSVFPVGERPPVILAVPGYRRVDDVEGTALPHFRTYWPDDDELLLRYRGWAAENSKRFLAGVVVVGTVDQVLLSSLTVAHAHLRASALLRQLLVVDEVHASDFYMTRILEDVVERQVGAGGHALLMSATLGSASRARLLAKASGKAVADLAVLDDAVCDPYPLITLGSASGVEALAVDDVGTEKAVTFESEAILDDPDRIAVQAFTAAQAGARVLVIRNTVTGCWAVQEALEGRAGAAGQAELLFSCCGVICPHHSRFAKGDRRLLDEAVEASYGHERPPGGLVAVATQTVEQSLDIDADLMLTDLCPMDVLLQRIGRLHRHERQRPGGFESAHVVVIVPEARDLSGFIAASGAGAGRHGLGRVYQDLRIVQASWDLLVTMRTISIPADNRRLVELSTHPEALERGLRGRNEKWRAHERWVAGAQTADRGVAMLNIIPRDQSFTDLRFPDDRKIPTRLGEFDRLAQFVPPVTGPFGKEVNEIAIPSYMVAEGTATDLVEATEVQAIAGRVDFDYGPTHFLYDRLGLH